MDLAGLRTDADRETALPQQFEHVVVFRPDDGFQHVNPGCGSSLTELSEQDRAQAAALVLVRHRQRELGFARASLDVHGVPDDVALRTGHRDEPVTRRVVDGDHLLGQRICIRDCGEETEDAGFHREIGKESGQVSLIFRAYGSHRQRGPIAKHDGRLAVCRICRGQRLRMLGGSDAKPRPACLAE